jgi:hypothetical protein
MNDKLETFGRRDYSFTEVLTGNFLQNWLDKRGVGV